MKELKIKPVVLPVEFCEPALADLQRTIHEEVSEGAVVRLDAQAVERFDAAALQLILVFLDSGHAAAPAVNNLSELLIAGFKDIGATEDTLNSLLGSESDLSGMNE